MKLAIFDFDGTLFPKDTLPFLLHEWKNLKYSKAKYYKTCASVIFLYIQYKTGITKMSREEIRQAGFKKFNTILNGMTKEEVDNFFLKASQKIIPLLNKNVVSEVEKCRSDGFHLVLLSGAHLNFLKNIGEYLNFNTVIGTELSFTNNIFDSGKELKVISGKLKKQKILEYFKTQEIDWIKSKSYADGYFDMDILELTGHPVAVNPDKKLKETAIVKNWEIIN